MFKKNYQHNKVSVRVKDESKPDFNHIDGIIKVEQAYPSVKELAGIYILLVREGYADWVKDQVHKMDDIEFCAKIHF